MVKTDLERRHDRFIRRLKGSSIEHSSQISKELTHLTASALVPEFSFLPESIGLVYGDSSRGAGVLFREPTPRPLAADNRTLVPYFSLYGGDLKNPADKSLMIQLIEHNAVLGEEVDYFIENIVGKVVRNWTYFARNFGLLLELHGQNTLLEIDQNLQPQRMVYRDFQATYVDRELRALNGLDIPVDKHIVGEESGTTRETQLSLAYDHQVGDFLLERLLNTFIESYPQYKKEDLYTEVQKQFRSGFPEATSIFPPQTYTYGKQQLGSNDVVLVQKHQKPLFR